MNKYSDILLIAESMELGEQRREICPYCHGGSSNERSLSLTMDENGTLRWMCHRGSCDLPPGTNGEVAHINQRHRPLDKPKPKFTGATKPLHPLMKRWIQRTWGIVDIPYWWWTVDYGGRIAMSIRSPRYMHRGWVLRTPQDCVRPKTLTYIDEGEVTLSWYLTDPHAPTVLVEDIPSAVRASAYINAVALLGTGIGPDKANEIAAYAPRPILLAYDQDATQLAFRAEKKYGLQWGDTKILPLEKDIKDMKEKELCKLLKVGN
jgi:hypothetical protein